MNETYYSWEILSEKVAVKQVDKSVIDYSETGIPIEIRKFWRAEDLVQGGIKNIQLYYRGVYYRARIHMENRTSMRTKLSWTKDLTKNIDLKHGYPGIRFERLGDDTYRVDFIFDSIINDDIYQDIKDMYEVQRDAKGEVEGRMGVYFSKKYERNPKNRKAAIKIHGLKCAVCGFDFQEKYGDLGQGFIEIHHLKPLSSLNEEVIVNPKDDLRPICSNCHRMIHRRKGRVYSIEELQEIIYNHNE